MKYGLKETTLLILENFFKKYQFIDKVMIFGSRVRGDYSRSSDIDLCVFSKNMSSRDFSKLRFEIDELPILQKIDIIHFEKIDSNLQKNIIQYGDYILK